MKGKALLLLLLVRSLIYATDLSPIVYVHIGDRLPEHFETSLHQTRLFNRESPIYAIVSKAVIETRDDLAKKYNVAFVDHKALHRDELYRHFLVFKKPRGQHARRDLSFRIGMYSAERYFLLKSFMQERDLHDVVYIEDDVMLYQSIEDLLPIFRESYPNMAIPFDSPVRGFAAIMYISSAESMLPLLKITSWSYNKSRCPDFLCLMKCRKDYGEEALGHLPVLPPDYAKNTGLIDPRDKYPFDFVRIQLSTDLIDEDCYSRYIDRFDSLFDTTAIGQYFAGTLQGHSAGFINWQAVFDPSHFTYTWERDEENRWIPYLNYLDKKYRLNNLHVQSKQLYRFLSDNEEIVMPAHEIDFTN